MLNGIITKGAAVVALVATVAAWGFYMDAQAKGRRILDLEIQNAAKDADNRALAQVGAGRQRVEISYRDAIQGLDPHALSAICLAELGPTYDAVERMRADDAAGRTAVRPARRLRAADAGPKPGR